MGVGPTSLVLGVIENDEDLRELSEAQIRERLRFFRNWKMTDVTYALGRMDGLTSALDFDAALGKDETGSLLERRISWEEFYRIAHDTEKVAPVATNLMRARNAVHSILPCDWMSSGMHRVLIKR